MSCDDRCYNKHSDWYKHDDCNTCPGHDCSAKGCSVCRAPGGSRDMGRIWVVHPESESAWVDTPEMLNKSMGTVMEAGPAVTGKKEELFSYYERPDVVFRGWTIKEGF